MQVIKLVYLGVNAGLSLITIVKIKTSKSENITE